MDGQPAQDQEFDVIDLDDVIDLTGATPERVITLPEAGEATQEPPAPAPRTKSPYETPDTRRRSVLGLWVDTKF